MAWREQANFTNVSVEGDFMWSVSMSVGAEATNAITTAITVTDAVTGAAPGEAVALPFYISSDANGQVLEAGTDLALTAGTDGLIILSGGDSKVYGHIVTETTGEMDFVITDAGADTYYINIILPSGKTVTSGAITLAA